ncbi:MAG TPA: hypothetical protein VMH81_28955 [Bryobacteraceae bacterium]|nr:hypothetical protein [Bryobacteraceae bacterium]
MKHLLVVSLVSLASVCVMRADTVTEITFTGVCSDCKGDAVATLSVTGFSLGTVFDLTLDDFMSFHYLGTDLTSPFTIDKSDVSSVSGSLGPTFPGSYGVELVPTTIGLRSFSSLADGSWGVSSGQGQDDFGSASSYSLAPTSVPEPAAMQLMALVFLAVSCLARRRCAGF